MSNIDTVADGKIIVWNSTAVEALSHVPDQYFDAVVTDPPYGLSKEPDMAEVMRHWLAGDDYEHTGSGFMGKSWDSFVPGPSVWRECFRVLKPGGHLLSFAGSRTQDLMGLAIRLAGFEIRDSIAWLYGSGFPKSLDVPKAIDKAAGAEREVIGPPRGIGGRDPDKHVALPGDEVYAGKWGNRWAANETAPATEPAQQWQGWGTALKPAFEPIVVARKPLAGTVAATVLEHGTGALNIDACRIAHNEPQGKPSTGMHGKRAGIMGETVERHRETTAASTAGRWPTNVVMDESQAADLDAQSGVTTGRNGGKGGWRHDGYVGGTSDADRETATYRDSGGASRFFPVFRYQAKAPAKERPKVDGIAHPTVKPLELMRWLVRLVTPPDGVILDPFAGSGTTGEAALLEGFRAVLVEDFPDYLPLILARLGRHEAA